MTFEEAKQRKDYKFLLNGIEKSIEDIRNNYMKDMLENGEPERGCAVLEIGYADIEVNIFTREQCIFNAPKDDKAPVIDYFTCLKRGEDNDDWESDRYLDRKPNVDWHAADWKEQLERDMFEALNKYAEDNGYSFDHAN